MEGRCEEFLAPLALCRILVAADLLAAVPVISHGFCEVLAPGHCEVYSRAQRCVVYMLLKDIQKAVLFQNSEIFRDMW